jgi:hypothetical protein
MMNLLISIFSNVQADFTEEKHLRRAESTSELLTDVFDIMTVLG